MGLDIYLDTIENREQNKRHEEEWNALYDRKDRGEITEAEYDELRKAITPYASHVDRPSETNPGHLFNKRYLRSGYNSGGFNHAVPNFLATTTGDEYPNERGSLYWIFEPMGREWDGDDGLLTETDIPKLIECRKRAEGIAAELANSDRLRVLTVSPNQLMGPEWLDIDEGKALALVREKATEYGDRKGWWTNRDMGWFGGTLNVIAMVPGGQKQFLRDGRWPCVHVIYRADAEGFESYVESARIVVEFCDEAIALIEKDGSAELSWSG